MRKFSVKEVEVEESGVVFLSNILTEAELEHGTLLFVKKKRRSSYVVRMKRKKTLKENQSRCRLPGTTPDKLNNNQTAIGER